MSGLTLVPGVLRFVATDLNWSGKTHFLLQLYSFMLPTHKGRGKFDFEKALPTVIWKYWSIFKIYHQHSTKVDTMYYKLF